MFATSGYFRGVTCPYFVNGLCERPYCHFRHVKPSVRENSTKTLSVSEGTTLSEDGASSESSSAGGRAGSGSLLSMVGQAIKQVERDIERDRASLTTIKTKTHSSNAAVGAGGYVYKPTPITSSNSASASAGATSKRSVQEYDPGRSNSAKYEPTPIRLLKQKSDKSKTSNKYRVDTQDHVNDNEYDPACNYSTVGKSQKRYAPAENTVDSKKAKHDDDLDEYEPMVIDAVFSDEEENRTENSDKKDKNQESQNELAKKAEAAKNKKADGVFEMDVNAILGLGSSEDKNGKSQKKETSGSKDSHKSNRHKSLGSKDREKSAKHKHSSKSDSRSKEKENSSQGKSSSGQAHKDASVKTEKTENDRNIFSLIGGDPSGNDGGILEVKSEKDDNVNASENRHKADSHSSSNSSRSDRHKTSSNTQKSSSRSHRSSSSSSSSKDKHSSSNSSKDKHSSSHSSKDKHSSSHSSKHSSSHSSKDKHSSHSSSSNKDKHSSSRHHSSSHSSSKHHSSSSKDRPHHSRDHAGLKKITIKSENKPKKMPISNADLFGDDSDNDSDDVVIVEPPKVDIPVVELSSEESDNEAGPPSPQTSYPETNFLPETTSTSESDEDSEGEGEGEDEGDDHEEPFTSTLNDLTDDQLESLERSLDSEDTYDECLRIFNEESSRAPQTMVHPKAKIQDKEAEEEPTIVLGKKRVSRVSEKDGLPRTPIVKVNARPSPAQIVHQRILAMQKAAAEAAQNQRNQDVDPLGSTHGQLKHRVAHTPKKTPSVKVPTPVGSVAKTVMSDPVKRVSHTQKQTAVSKRPTIPSDFGTKVPMTIRQRYLNIFIDDCLKIYPREEDAFKRALSEEKAVYNRSTSKKIYLNVAVNCVKRLRNEILAKNPNKNKTTPTKNGPKQFSHEALLGGRMAAKTSFTVKRSGSTPNQPLSLTESNIYHRLMHYLLTEQQRRDNGYPFMSEQSGVAVIQFDDSRKRVVKMGETNERLCVRCGKRFLVNSDGKYANDENCVHHWGKLWKRKIGNSIESRYNCCSEDANSTGCSIGKAHVHEQNKFSRLKGYMKTMPKSPPPGGNFGVFALDCEMVYTVAGLELARVTVVNSQLESVYEQVVKPSAELIDPNTRFSGLTEQDFIGVRTTIRDVQAVLLSMFSADTILVGHSLESDLVALKLVHKSVVDTSVVFPHRLGPPYKRALRNLMADHLQKIIQDDVGGHDSQEDAIAAMELMRFKLKEDAKKENRRQ